MVRRDVTVRVLCYIFVLMYICAGKYTYVRVYVNCFG